MADCSKNKNPLIRGGYNQQQRRLAGLQPGYVKVDERNFEHWIDFARNFGAYIKYYNNYDQVEGNWQPFFESDVSAQLSIIAVQNVEDYRLSIKSLFSSLQSKDFKNNEPKLKENFGLLFSATFTLAKQIDLINYRLPEEVLLKNIITNLIQTKLRPAFRRLLQYYFEAKAFQPATGLISEMDKPDWKILGGTVRQASTIVTEGLLPIWKPDTFTDWNNYVSFYSNPANHDYSIYGTSAADTNIADVAELYQRINHAVNHNLFSSLFDEFLKAFAKIKSESILYLEKTLNDWNTHEPYYALFLTFLKLFKVSQEQMNGIAGRHLDFYYQEVLQLKPKPALPNHAHLVFELAKPVNSYLLPKGTLFKAGKDSLKKDVFYKLDDNIVLNKATAVEFKSFFKAGGAEAGFNGMLFASPIANSADGLGAPIKTPAMEWSSFANKVYVDGAFKSIAMPETSVGFAVASHYLLLSEGERRIYLKLFADNNSALRNKKFSFYLTTAKGWYQANATFNTGSEGYANNYGQFVIDIPSSAPPIVGYSAKVHGETYDTALPILKVILENKAGDPQYDSLKDVHLTRLKLKVAVGSESQPFNQTGIKTLSLQNDVGILDPAKPFLPFGPAPKKGAAFVIGNKEVFEKKNAEFRFSIEWDGLLESQKDFDFNLVDRFYPTAKIQFLENGQWLDAPFTQLIQDWQTNGKKQSTEPGEVEIIWGRLAKIYFPSDYEAIHANASVDPDDEYKEYSINSRNGFMRLLLTADFQFQEYQTALINHLIGKANQSIAADVEAPKEPYTPKIRSIYLSYTAEVEYNLSTTDASQFENRDQRFFHIYPFGQAEQHAFLSGAGSVFLFPQFKHEQRNEEGLLVRTDSISEFYIGIKDLFPSQVLTLLFQLAEGTADPLQLKPEPHISWSYLSKNAWITFNKLDVIDQTNQLVQSGIVTFSFPDNGTNTNSLLPSGLHWIRASIAQSAEAVCKIISITAQAAVVTFDDQYNASDFLLAPLPAKTISKLKEPISAIKKITQPYASFGGRATETAEHFYMRVSERLRHKQRAITIWDYEHLVLEAFPQIHKVKCLNHTRYEPGIFYNEISPGHVTIITIPQLRNQNAINPLRPYTYRADLENIKQYLRKLISCHVQLHVENPRFEEVRMQMMVKFFPGFDESYYTALLQQEITSFLTPWASSDTTDIEFGGKVHKSVMINFIEERSYVDYITDVMMFHDKQDGSPESNDMDEIVASTAMSILVSAPAKEHVITPIKISDEVLEKCSDKKSELVSR